jgi:hypothetical protein
VYARTVSPDFVWIVLSVDSVNMRCLLSFAAWNLSSTSVDSDFPMLRDIFAVGLQRHRSYFRTKVSANRVVEYVVFRLTSCSRLQRRNLQNIVEN